MTVIPPDVRVSDKHRHSTLTPYPVALALQHTLAQERAAGAIPDTLMLVQHPPVITVGRSGSTLNIRVAAQELHRRGVSVVDVERGGDVVLHCPGQLVGYPLLDLRARGGDLHRYIHDLEEVLLRVLSGYGISAERIPGKTGAWVGGRKIGFVGIAVKRWITLHGFCLNITPDLLLFDLIHPCGMAGVQVTSVAALTAHAVEMVEAAGRTAAAFADVFGKVAVRNLVVPDAMEGTVCPAGR